MCYRQALLYIYIPIIAVIESSKYLSDNNKICLLTYALGKYFLNRDDDGDRDCYKKIAE